MRFCIECELPFSRSDFWRLRATRGFLQFVVADGLLKKMEATPTEVDNDGWATRTSRYSPAHVDCPDFVRAFIGDTMFEVDDEQRWHDVLAPFEQQYRIRPSFLQTISRTSGTLYVDLHPDHPAHPEEEPSHVKDTPSSSSPVSAIHVSSSVVPELIPAAADHDEDLNSVESATDAEGSDAGDSDCAKEPLEYTALLALLPPSDKCLHVVKGDTRVSILTLGWFVERAIVHNLRSFYKAYPATVARFRQKLYAEFAHGDPSVPCSVVVDRFLDQEASLERDTAADKKPDSAQPESTLVLESLVVEDPADIVDDMETVC